MQSTAWIFAVLGAPTDGLRSVIHLQMVYGLYQKKYLSNFHFTWMVFVVCLQLIDNCFDLPKSG